MRRSRRTLLSVLCLGVHTIYQLSLHTGFAHIHYLQIPTANSKTLGLRAKSLDRRGLSDFSDSSLFRQSDATFSGGVTPPGLSRPMTLAGKEYGSQVDECPPAPPVHGNFRVGLAFWS